MTKIDGAPKGEPPLPSSNHSSQVDGLDLVQRHEIIRCDDPHRIFDPDGANAAMFEKNSAFDPRSDLIGSKG